MSALGRKRLQSCSLTNIIFPMKRYKKIIIVAILSISGIGLFSYTANPSSNFFEIAKNIEIFTNVYKEINTYYVDDVEPAALMRTGVDAMLQSLDPYTNFISESEIEGYKFMTTGKYGGIGASIRKVDDYVIIAEPYEGFPAHKFGMLAGDVILEVEGQSAKGKNTDEVSEILKGTPGTNVNILVQRPGVEKSMKFTLVREEIQIDNVPYYGMVNDAIGYITLTTFTENAGDNVAKALEELKKNNNLKGIIFDLRGNGGGLLREAVNVTNVFVEKGLTTVTTKSKVAEWDKEYKTLNNPTDKNIPLAILVDGGSASASEIVSGAIQDFDRGVLLGERTYGKGLVQNTKDVGYNSKVKMRISKYYIPSGRCIQGVNYEGGEAKKIVDSLKTEFKTINGRKVYDGGGVNPDIKIEKEAYEEITISLLRENLIFDYVTQWVLKNPKPESIELISYSDNDFNDFLNYSKNKDYSYETNSEKIIKELETAIENDKFTDATIQSRLNSLKETISLEKNQEIIKYKSQIISEIKKEIATRYFLQKGKIQKHFK